MKYDSFNSLLTRARRFTGSQKLFYVSSKTSDNISRASVFKNDYGKFHLQRPMQRPMQHPMQRPKQRPELEDY